MSDEQKSTQAAETSQFTKFWTQEKIEEAITDEDEWVKFVELSSFPPYPASFDLEAICAVWITRDIRAKPIVDKFVELGILLQEGDKYYVPEDVSQLANSYRE